MMIIAAYLRSVRLAAAAAAAVTECLVTCMPAMLPTGIVVSGVCLCVCVSVSLKKISKITNQKSVKLDRNMPHGER